MIKKNYRLEGATPETRKLELQFRQAHDHITSLGMVLGKDAPAIHRDFDDAYQCISSRAGLLQNISLSTADVHAFEDKLDALSAEIASHNHKAQVLKELRTLRINCVSHIKKHEAPAASEPAPKPVAPVVEAKGHNPIASSSVRAQVVDDEVWVSVNDLERALGGLKIYYTTPAAVTPKKTLAAPRGN